MPENSEPQKWEPPELTPLQKLRQKLVQAGENEAQINKIVALDSKALVTKARSMFIAARSKGDEQVAKEWAILGIAMLEKDLPAGVEDYD